MDMTDCRKRKGGQYGTTANKIMMLYSRRQFLFLMAIVAGPSWFQSIMGLSLASRFGKKNNIKQQEPQQKNRVLVTPPPPPDVVVDDEEKQQSRRRRNCQQKENVEDDDDDDDDDEYDGDEEDCVPPNWVFLYPQPCACLFPEFGASVGSVTNIPPDSCQGGYYGHDASLDPQHVLEHGLPQRGNDWDLLRHAVQSGSSAFRGTTKQIVFPEDGTGAASFAGDGGYVYEVTCVPSWDVNKHLQGRRLVSESAMLGTKRFGGNIVLGEHEFAIASRVPVEHIKRYGKVVESAASGVLFVPRNAWTENPKWNPTFCKYSVSDSTCQETVAAALR